MKHNLNLIENKYSKEELEYNINLFDEDDWAYISICQNLSEKFIDKHSDKIHWVFISKHQILSEEFIEKHSDKVRWENVSFYQELSEKFIIKHINKISIYWLMYNKNITEEIKEEIKTLKEII
jgi:hypothetical protein